MSSETKEIKILKLKLINYGVLALRWYLIFYMVNYGWSKLTLNQFGVYDVSILDRPIKDIDSFYIAWHLFGRSTFFNISAGILEITGGILLIFNRTIILGAILILIILTQILIIDISFTTGIHGFSLPVRVGGMITADLLILCYNRNTISILWRTLLLSSNNKFKFKWWIYLLLPIIGFLMDFVFGLITLPLSTLLNWLFS